MILMCLIISNFVIDLYTYLKIKNNIQKKKTKKKIPSVKYIAKEDNIYQIE